MFDELRGALPADLSVRHPTVGDHASIVELVPRWWADSRSPEEAAELAGLVQPLFLEHFADTSVLASNAHGAIKAFLLGFLSQTHPDQAYIHFVGVAPELRGAGVGAALYDWFFTAVHAAGLTEISAITGQHNHGSIAFHRAMGFTVDTTAAMVRFRRSHRRG